MNVAAMAAVTSQLPAQLVPTAFPPPAPPPPPKAFVEPPPVPGVTDSQHVDMYL